MEVMANGLRLYCEKSGTGPPVVLVHGNSANLHFFDALVPHLETQYTVYRFDSRRHGKSEKPKQISYDLLAQDTACLIQELGIRRPALIGSSDGGIVGLLLCIQYPDLLCCNIACGANTHPGKLKGWFYWMFKLASLKPGQQTLKMVVEEPDISLESLGKIVTPTLVMAGERDITVKGHQEEIAGAIPGARLCILEGESHTSYLTKPEVFMRCASSFLQEHCVPAP